MTNTSRFALGAASAAAAVAAGATAAYTPPAVALLIAAVLAVVWVLRSVFAAYCAAVLGFAALGGIVGDIEVAGIRVSALITVTLFGLALVVWFGKPSLSVGRAGVVWGLWLVYALALLLLFGRTTASVQNVTIYASFVLTLLVAAARRERALAGWIVAAAVVGAVVYLVSVARFGMGTSAVLAPRSFAAFAVTGVVCAIAWVRSGNRRAWWLVAFLLGVILLSLSRTALVTGVVLIPLAWFEVRRPRSLLAALVLLGSLAGGLWWSFDQVPAVRERFTGGDAVTLHGLPVNLEGRGVVWDWVLEDAAGSRWVGHGPGSADDLVATRSRGVVGNPHSDWLRLYHDLGFIGLGLWSVAYVLALRATRKAWLRDRHPIHLAAFLALVGTAPLMTTDNVLIYASFMLPVALLVGTSLAAEVAASQRKPLASASDALLGVTPTRPLVGTSRWGTARELERWIRS